jgi:hypothetical protein
LFALFLPALAFGQNFAVSGGFIVAVPKGEYATKVDHYGYGLEIYGAYAPATAPYSAGITLRFMSNGSESSREPLSPTIPGVFVDWSRSNNFFQFELEGRMQPNTGFLRPYLSGMIGANLLTTITSIKNESTGEEIASSTNESDGAFNYGGGGGVDVLLWSAPEEGAVEGDVRQVLLHCGVSYVFGGEAKYGTITRASGSVEYGVAQSKTDVMLYQVGVTVTF